MTAVLALTSNPVDYVFVGALETLRSWFPEDPARTDPEAAA